MQALDSESIELGGATNYGTGLYGAGLYSSLAGQYVLFQPVPFGIIWEPYFVVCNTNSSSFTVFGVYIDTTDPQNLLGVTINGNGDQVSLPAVQVDNNHILIGVWWGGDTGSIASAVLVGDEGQLQT